MNKQTLKQQIRKKYLQIRNTFPNKEQITLTINDYLEKFLEPYQRIALYYPINNEVNIWPVVKKLYQHKDIYLPVTNEVLVFRRLTDINRLVMGKMGILEPTGPKINNINDLEVIVIPTIAISPGGYRLGYGKGYYDKCLDGYCGIKVGVIYSFQMCEIEYKEEHDLKFDIIISEKGYQKIGE